MLADGLEFKDAILGTQHNLLTNTKKRKKKKLKGSFPPNLRRRNCRTKSAISCNKSFVRK